MITQARLKELLVYEPETGLFTWRIASSNRIKIGDIAGHKSKDYVTIRVDRRLYPAHCLAWLYMTGVWSTLLIDHKDTDKYNNIWYNLREATTSQNAGNQFRKNNTSGYKGVHWVKRRNKWMAAITISGKTKGLGYFDKIEDAANAYKLAAKDAFGEYSGQLERQCHEQKESS